MPHLKRALRAAGLRDVRTDSTTRAMYSSDASLYRVTPSAVAFPASSDEIVAAVSAAADLDFSVTARGAGTSVAGNAIGPGLVLDLSRHLGRIIELDAEEQTARVQPGVVLDDLQRAASRHGLRFGPDPSTHNRCTIGGMIGNDACGSRALAYGRTADNVVGLDVVTGRGDVLSARRSDAGVSVDGFRDGVASLRHLVGQNLGILRTEFGRFGRQISGYALHQLLPENRFDLVRALVGSEGTLGVVTQATVRLVREPADRILVALAFPTIVEAAAAAPAVLPCRPTACEGIDSRIVDVVRRRRGRVPELPRGSAWLLVELSGESRTETLDLAHALVTSVTALDFRIIEEAQEAAALWKIREDGAGLAGRAPSGAPAWAGWEDAAVPVDALGAYLGEFEDLVAEHGLSHMPFGHFGDGCVHTRLDFGLDRPDGPMRMRSFLEQAATLVARHAGSFSGEHGDGRARSELLPRMYSPRAIALMAAVKDVFDPAGRLNPGVLVDPAPLDRDLRINAALGPLTDVGFAYPEDHGDFNLAVHRCTGVGRCRSTTAAAGTVMCPSYVATREEKDSTRGRARVLQEMVAGDTVKGWRDSAVHEVLDLCLSCKGCASDCPTGVDMATWKSEVLHQTYRGRLRPMSHYSLGRLPQWARLAGKVPRAANLVSRTPVLRRVLLRLAGVDYRRSTPPFAAETFREWFAGRGLLQSESTDDVVLFVDTFTDHFSPDVGKAMVTVLEQAGLRISLSDPSVCCALTWISTGQLDKAKHMLGRSVTALDDAEKPVPIVGIEPSCTAVLRHDASALLNDEAAKRVAARVVTLAELLESVEDWSPPDLTGTTVLAQPHCHHHAVMGWGPDAALLERARTTVERLGGCCGLAGNFGMERGHYDLSVAVAESQLLPAIRGAAPDALIVADGFSCRTQIGDLAGVDSVHLAQVLADRIGQQRQASRHTRRTTQ